MRTTPGMRRPRVGRGRNDSVPVFIERDTKRSRGRARALAHKTHEPDHTCTVHGVFDSLPRQLALFVRHALSGYRCWCSRFDRAAELPRAMQRKAATRTRLREPESICHGELSLFPHSKKKRGTTKRLQRAGMQKINEASRRACPNEQSELID